MVFNSRKVESALSSKGFSKSNSDHRWYILYDENQKRTRVRTFVSHNGQDIGDYLITQMSKQMKISKKQFKDFVECTYTKEMLLNFLREKNEL